MSRWIEGKIVKIHKWANDLYSIFIHSEIEPFVAGQFTQIGLGDPQKPLFRPYSFVNAPDDPLLEFLFNLVPEGNLTPQLIELKKDDAIWVAKKPTGRFTVANLEPSENLCCVATGTGLGVFLSILKTPEPWEKFSKIHLVHSVSYGTDLSHQELIQSFTEKYSDRFNFIPIVTQEEYEGSFKQRVTELLSSGELEKAMSSPITPENAQVMLCGNAGMINEMRALLAQKGLKIKLPGKEGQVTIESYYKP